MKSILSYIILFCFAFFVLFFSQCKKEEEQKSNPDFIYQPPLPPDTIWFENFSYDTVFPNEYLMHLPGSWWNYSDGSTITCDSWEACTLYDKTSFYPDSIYIESDVKYLPRLSTEFKTHGDSWLFRNENYNTVYLELISNETGLNSTYIEDIFSNDWYYKYTTRTNEFLDSMNVGTEIYYDITKMTFNKTQYFPDFGAGPPRIISIKYFARNVGLIQSENALNSAIDFDTVKLADFFIAD